MFDVYKCYFLTPIRIGILLFFSYVVFLWPGEMSPDSMVQYAAAVSGQYSDHHPFIMSFLWRYLNYLHTGSGLMLLFHLCLLWSGVFFIYRSLEQYAWSPFLFGIPFIPNVWAYAGMIWKDVGCAFSFFCVLSYMSYACLCKKNITLPKLFLMLIILGYGSLVKFQGAYLAPIVLVWIAWHRVHYGTFRQFSLSAIPVAMIFYGMVYGITLIGPTVKQDHAWQFVKLYDLAAISVQTGEDLFPKENKTAIFSMEEVYKRFNHKRVDDLVYGDAILIKSKNEEERNVLYQTWLKQVISHPFLYLHHRLVNLWDTLQPIPGFYKITDFISRVVPEMPFIEKNLIGLAKIPCYLFLAHFMTILLGIFYFGLSVATYYQNKYQRASIPLFFLTSTALFLVFILLFCSMAGTPRYTYLSVVLINGAHGFAYVCWRDFFKYKRREEGEVKRA